VKKTLFIVFWMLIVNVFSANAFEVEITDSNNDIIVINGESDSSSSVSLLVLNPDKTLGALKNDDYLYNSEIIQNFSKAETDENNKYSIKIKMNNDYCSGGKFNFIINESGNKSSKLFTYYFNTEKKHKIEQINSYTEKEIINNIDKIIEMYGLDSSSLYVNGNTEFIAETLYNYRESCVNKKFDINIENFEQIIKEILLLSAINNGQSDLLIADGKLLYFDNYLKLSETDIYMDYINSISEVGIKKINDEMLSKKYKNAQEITDFFKTSVLYNVIKNYTEYGYGHIKTFLDKYHDEYCLFGLNIKDNVSDSVYKDILNDSSNNLTDLKQHYNALVKNTGSNSGSSRGSGSSESSINSKIVTSENAGFVSNDIIFNDIDSVDWAKESIEYLYNNGIISDVGDAKFEPERAVTRGEFVKLVVTAFKLKDNGFVTHFIDSKNHWAEPYVAIAESLNIVKGVSDDYFGVDERITREDAAVVLRRIAGTSQTYIKQPFSDDDKISEYAVDAVYYLKEKKIIQGKDGNVFEPKSELTRAETSKIIYNALFSNFKQIASDMNSNLSLLEGSFSENNLSSKMIRPKLIYAGSESSKIKLDMLTANSEQIKLDQISIVSPSANILSENKVSDNVISEVEDDMNFCKQVGIIDDSVVGEDYVSRIGFAKVMSNIVFGQSIEEDFIESKYTDVPASQAFIVDYVTKQNLLSAEGEFRPNDKITYYDLIKAIVNFLGYSDKTDGTKLSYFAVANSMKINVLNAVDKDYITYNGLAKVLKSAVKVKMLEKEINNDKSYSYVETDHYLKLYKDIDYTTDVVSANFYGVLTGKLSLDRNHIKVGDSTYKLTSESMPIRFCLGYSATIFYDTKEDYIIYYDLVNNSTFKIDGADAISIDNSKIYYYNANGIKKNASLSKSFVMLYNNSVVSNYSKDFIAKAFENMDGNIVCIDNNNDKIYDVVLINAYETHVVADIIDNVIYSKFNPSRVIKVNDEETAIVNVLNEPVKFSDIDKGDIVCVSSDLDGNINYITVVIDSISEYISAINFGNKGEIESVFINQSEYSLAESYKIKSDEDNIKVGDRVTLYFNKDKKIAKMDKCDFLDYKIGYLINMARNNGIDEKYSIKLFSSKGKMEMYGIDDCIKTTFDNIKIKTSELMSLLTSSDGLIKRQPVLYRLNSENKVDWIDYCGNKTDKDKVDGLYYYTVFDDAKKDNISIGYVPNYYTFSGKLLFSTGTIIFVIPDENNRDDDDLYQIGNTSYITEGLVIEKDYKYVEGSDTLPKPTVKQEVVAYGTHKSSPVADILVKVDMRGKLFNSTDRLALVSNVRKTINENNDVVTEYTVWYAGKEKTFTYEENKANLGTLKDTVIEAGDAIRVTTNANGEIELLSLVYDLSENKLSTDSPAVNQTKQYYKSAERFVFGKVFYKDEQTFGVEFVNQSGKTEREYYLLSTANQIYNCKNIEGNNIITSIAKPTSIYDSEQYADHASNCLVQLYDGKLATVILYNKRS